MDDAPRMHRDTLAFGLTMAGATCWAVVPVAAFFEKQGGDPIEAMLGALMVGAAVGALTAAAVWRAVSLISVAVTAAVCAAGAIGCVRALQLRGMPYVDLLDVPIAALTAAAGVAGAWLGRRSMRPRPALVAALMSLATAGVMGVLFGALTVFGVRDSSLWLLIFFVSATPAIVLAVWLCRDAEVGAIAGWVFLLCAVMVMITGIATRDIHPIDLFFAGSMVGTVAAGGTALVAAVARQFFPSLPAPPEMPVARVR